MVRSSSTPSAAKQQLSKAFLQLLQQLITAASKQQAARSNIWVKTGCNLLLRALTRSPQFLCDPMLPLLPEDAYSMLTWLRELSMGSKATGVSSAGSAAEVPSASSTAGAAAAQQSVAKLVWRDDKFYLLVTKLLITATGLLPEDALAAAAAAAYQESGEPMPPSTVEAEAAANGRHAVGTTANGHKAATVGWASLPNSNGVTQSSNMDPQLLCDLLEWSSTKVKLALQQLLGHAGTQASLWAHCTSQTVQQSLMRPCKSVHRTMSCTCSRELQDTQVLCLKAVYQLCITCNSYCRNTAQDSRLLPLLLHPAGAADAAPSREATTASAQLAATCIHTLQAGPQLRPELQQKLTQQVEELLEIALAVGGLQEQSRTADRDSNCLWPLTCFPQHLPAQSVDGCLSAVTVASHQCEVSAAPLFTATVQVKQQ